MTTSKDPGLPWPAATQAIATGLVLGAAWLSCSLYFLLELRSADLMRALADRVHISLLESRRREKDFLLRSLVDTEFYRNGTSPYLKQHQEAQSEMKSASADLVGRLPPDWPADLGSLPEKRLAYEEAFTVLVDRYRRLGWKEFGAEGRWKESARDLGAAVRGTGNRGLEAAWLRLEADLQEYLRLSDPVSLRAMRDSAERLREQGRQELPGTSSVLGPLLDRYLTQLAAYHELELEIGLSEDLGLNSRLRSAAHTIEPLVARVAGHAAADYTQAARRLKMGFGISSLLLSGLLAATFFLARRARQRSALLSQTAAELSRSNDELQQFAYVASHDLQEPLRAVAGCVGLLEQREQGKLDEKSSGFIRHAVEGCVRMEALIEDLLGLSRVGTQGKPFVQTDLGPVLDLAIANLERPLRESGARITRDPLPTARIDPTQMLQVFQNLLANAIKFRGERRPEIHVGAGRLPKAWRISVRDNGIGIEPQYFERIFRVFQRLHTRQEYPGSGMGLAICEKIVVRHGGRIWLESVPDRGTTFYFTLPDGGDVP